VDIRMSGLTKTYRGKVHALRGIDLEIGTGMYGLLGPNGAGKTTLMRILAGILRPSGGALTIDGEDATTEHGRQATKRVLGYLPQELGLYPDLSAREFLDYIGILKGMDEAHARRKQVGELLEMVGLEEAANRKLKTFSGGMKRRVGIAQALLNHPKLLIVDEPTAGLDPEERIRFRNLLAELGSNRLVLLSTHIVEDVAQTCQNLAILRDGQIAFRGTLGELVGAAAGRVWQVTLPEGSKIAGEFTVISTLHQGVSVQYRVVGEGAPESGAAVAAAPSLEDSYVWLMRERRAPVNV
jgi:ABC-2 type transport system ATP-binding protein